jgi:hypothetical protein
MKSNPQLQINHILKSNVNMCNFFWTNWAKCLHNGKYGAYGVSNTLLAASMSLLKVSTTAPM